MTVARIGFGTRVDTRPAQAVQMLVPFTINGVLAEPGSWVLIYPDRHDIVPDRKFKMLYREVTDEAPVQEQA